jgi:hypothetical protein
MEKPVEFDPQLCLNADQLEQSLSRQRERLGEITDDEQRSRRAEAMARVGTYVGMLRDAEAPLMRSGSFSFKLELNDGRWDVEEMDMSAAPRVVKPRPAGRPAREVFVCAPAA